MFRKIIDGLKFYRIYLLFLGLMILFVFITGFNGLYGQDSYEYLRYTNALIDFVKHGEPPGKGYWPLMYPISGVVFSLVFKTAFALQIISIISLVLAGVYLEKSLKVLYKCETKIARLSVVQFFLFSPYLLRASLTVMSDSLCLFFVTASCYYFIKFSGERKNNVFIAFVMCATAAICTRYAALMVIFIPAIFVKYIFAQKFNIKAFLLAGVGALVVLLPYLLIHSSSPLDFMHHEWFQGWSFKNIFGSGFDTADGNIVYTFPNIAYCFFNLGHPAYCFAGLIFLGVSIWLMIKMGISKMQWIILASVVLYAIFLAGIPFQNLRFLILSFPFVLILVFPGFIEIFRFLNNSKPNIIPFIISVCIIIQCGLFVRVFIPFYHDNKVEKIISKDVIEYNPATLYTFSIDGAVNSYGYKGKIVNMWKVKLDTMAISSSAMVLFDEKKFRMEWKNKNPMINWEYLKLNYQLTKMEDLPDDWELLSIKKAQ